MKPSASFLVLAVTAALLAAQTGAVGPNDPEPTFARKFCAEAKSLGDSLAYYPDGRLRAQISCAPNRDYVSAQFYDENGRLLRAEHMAPGLPGQHDVEIYEYQRAGPRPSRMLVYDSNGNLLKTQTAPAEDVVTGETSRDAVPPAAGERLSYDDYVNLCRTSAPFYQRFLLGEVKPLEFDVDQACACVARRIVSGANGPLALTPQEEVDEVAMYEPKSCVCPNANPGSSLAKNCEQR